MKKEKKKRSQIPCARTWLVKPILILNVDARVGVGTGSIKTYAFSLQATPIRVFFCKVAMGLRGSSHWCNRNNKPFCDSGMYLF